MGGKKQKRSTHVPMTSDGHICRREFLRKSISLASGLAAAGLGVFSGDAHGSRGVPPAGDPSLLPSNAESFVSEKASTQLSRALVIATKKASRGTNLQEFYAALLDASVKRLTGARRADDAWASLFAPDDVVALKVNAITGKRLSSSPALVKAIVDGVMSCGVRPGNIIVWDRTTWELDAAGFEVNFDTERPLCFGTDAPSMGYESEPTMLGDIGSCFSRIVTGRTTALINVPLLREHTLAGASIALKNYYGAIHNPNKYHSNGCSPFVADVYSHPAIRGKVRLIVCDALNVQFKSGPGYKPEWVSHLGSILVSRDPVALDTVGIEELEKLRKAAGLRTLAEERRYPGYLSVASDEAHRLGISDRSRIDVVNMELP